jgi:tetratricopeptide (TPR) repeat protein
MEDVALYNEKSLSALVRAIALSQGNFKLILARCNYGALRDRIVQRLRELSPVKIREIVLPESVKSLYTTIKAELGDEMPQALMVFGLESISDIKTVLKSSNYIREEFSKHFLFPLVLWVNDEVLKKLLRLAPDLESWATSVEFKFTTDELLDFLQEKVERIIADDLTTPRWICTSVNLESCSELEVAYQDLQSREQELEAEVEASLEFVLGLDDYANNQIDAALEHYQQSLAFWQHGHNLERQGRLLVNIGICYYRKAKQHLLESRYSWERSRDYLQQGIDVFTQAQRPELVAEHISKLCEILRRLQAWEQLQALAQQALTLHQTYGSPSQLAQDYGCLAEVALEQSRWREAEQLARQSLQILSTIPNRPTDEGGLYWFILGRSQEHLEQIQDATRSLEQARKENNPQDDPQLYIDILGKLRELYFQQGEYLKAFEIKRERSSIAYQYGFQAFVGAAYLHPKRQVINPALAQTGQQSIIAGEIAASGREQDVKRLIEKIKSTHHKLIVIHGQSGVGKSSILKAGLVAALKQEAIGDRDALPVLNRYYTNWVRELGRGIAEALEQVERQKFGSDLTPQPPSLQGKGESCSPLLAGEGLGERSILEQLRKNADRNLVTVLIFDQFEEFFFAAREKKERRRFFEFLQECLNIGFVKVILSLREDYLHYLLESERIIKLDAINGNILDKDIRYPLGNFSPEEAKAVIQSLTERSQFYLQPELIDELVRNLAGEEDSVRPIELQVVGAQLQADEIATLADYRQYGSKEKLVEKYLEAVVKDCGLENEQAARFVLYFLTDEKDTRPLKTRAELVTDFETADFASEVEKLDLVLLILVGSGLVLKVPDTPHQRYQLVHDYLVLFIRQSQQAREVAERKKDKEERQRIEAQLNQVLKRRLREAYIAGAGLITLAAVAGVFGVQSFRGQVNAQIDLLSANSERLFASEQDTDALVESLKAGQKLKQTWKFWVNPDTKIQVVATLQQAIYGVKDIELKTFTGHSAEVYSLAWSPDGKTIASGSSDKTIKLWNKEGKLLKTFTGHSAKVSSLAWSPDGKTIASASGDKTVKLWNLDLDNLLVLGCDWLQDYLANHPDPLEDLKECQNNSLFVAAVARQLAASDLVTKGEALTSQGDFKNAIAAYTKAQKLDPNLKISANSWNSLCWQGSLRGYAKDVMFACEKAVALAPTTENFRDSRGLARALTGNTKGAIEDFQAFIKSTKDTEKKTQRQRWVNALRAGKNPFTQEELKKLSDQ